MFVFVIDYLKKTERNLVENFFCEEQMIVKKRKHIIRKYIIRSRKVKEWKLSERAVGEKKKREKEKGKFHSGRRGNRMTGEYSCPDRTWNENL